jgi:hypothetical protein
MKRTTLVLAALCIAGLCGRALADVVVPLERQPLGSARIAAFWAMKYVSFSTMRPQGLVTKTPSVSGTAYYAMANIGGRPVAMLLDTATPAKLYVDTDHDGDLAEETPFTGAGGGGQSGGLMDALVGSPGRGASFSFDSVSVPLKDPDRTCEFRLQGMAEGGGNVYATMQPASARAGRVDLGGKAWQLLVIDADYDGRYDDAFAPPGAGAGEMRWDALVLDTRADRPASTSATSATLSGGGIMPLPKTVNIGGSWYGLKVAADGSSATLSPEQPTMGRLDVDCRQVELTLLSDSGYHHLMPSADGWQLPAGSYMATDLHLVDSVDGTGWTLSASYPTGPLRSFSIQADKPTKVDVGPPLVSSLSFDGNATMQSIGYELKGRAGEQYQAGAERRGVTQPAPAFVILDEQGKKLASGSFQYG